ncbi:MAG: NDP-sugar synthase [Euryarchaeota archaeon]|nr:NDP-sugar synthase [Euryarchaeota archaeon]
MSEAIVLAGGFGTRLRPITYSLHKLLVEVVGKPILGHLLDSLPREVTRVILAVHYLKESIQEYVNLRDDGREYIIVEEDRPLGTGGAIKNVEKYVQSDDFLVFNGDIISSLNPLELLNKRREKNAIGVISVYKVNDASQYGLVKFDDSMRIAEFIEKPKEYVGPAYINAGTYALSKEIFDYIEAGKEVSIEKEVFPNVIKYGLYAYPFEGYWIDCGTPGRLLRAKDLLLEAMGLDNYIGPGAKVLGSLIRSSVERNVIVERGCVVENSIIMHGCRIGEGSVIRGSVIGPEVDVPPGSVIVNSVIEGWTKLEGRVDVSGVKIRRRM